VIEWAHHNDADVEALQPGEEVRGYEEPVTGHGIFIGISGEGAIVEGFDSPEAAAAWLRQQADRLDPEGAEGGRRQHFTEAAGRLRAARVTTGYNGTRRPNGWASAATYLEGL
jgi:hypothetical protein